MSEREPSERGAQSSQADRTLLGVAPPRIESSAESPLRSPVFVRSGTSVADVEPPPLPRMALPSRPPSRPTSETPSAPEGLASLAESGRGVAWAAAMLKLPARVAGRELVLWQVLIPGLTTLAVLGLVLISLLGSASQRAASAALASRPDLPAARAPRASNPAAPPAEARASGPAAVDLAALAAKPPETLSSRELLSLATGASSVNARPPRRCARSSQPTQR